MSLRKRDKSSGTQSRRATSGATAQDVAQLAGVSPMTVSRVINGATNVRLETREAVQAAMKELNYKPNSAARSLAGAQIFRVGLLYGNPSANYLSELIVGALDAASQQGAQLLIEKCLGTDANAERTAATKLINGGAVAIILPSPHCESPSLLAELASNSVPVVAVTPGRAPPETSCVRIDDFQAAYAMTDHLIKLGHERIGFIKGNPAQTASGERERGFWAAMRDAGLDLSNCPVQQGYFTYRSGFEAAEKLINYNPRPTAIFASNDDMAAATITVAHKAGLDVPKDLSVVGFDDTPIATTIWPELTTIRQPISEMAGAALNQIVNLLRQRNSRSDPKVVDQLVDFQLIIRDSAAPPPKNS